MANVEESIAWVPVLHEGAEVFYCILPLFHAFGFTIGFLAGLRLGATIAMFPKFDTALVLAAQRRLPCTFFLGVPPMYERSSRRPKAQTSTCRRSTSPFRVRCLSRPRWPISGSTPRAVS